MGNPSLPLSRHLPSPSLGVLASRGSWLAPVHALAAWLMPARSRPPVTRRAPGSGSPSLAGALPGLPAIKTTCHRPAPAPCKAMTVSRLKIVREFDAAMSPSSAGRMMISGRMADVCAELDRLAQQESAETT